MKKNSDPVEVKLNDIIIIGLITKKGIMIKKKWIYGMKSWISIRLVLYLKK
jgi:hypothetical protein